MKTQEYVERGRPGDSPTPSPRDRCGCADLHQALAYGFLADTPVVETILASPLSDPEAHPEIATAVLPVGGRSVRMMLAGLPFGFRGPSQEERTLQVWEEVLRARPRAA